MVKEFTFKNVKKFPSNFMFQVQQEINGWAKKESARITSVAMVFAEDTLWVLVSY